ncbi:hypothetical protein FM114_02010 [Luteococcus japonicus LSP_Lj1]|uniref:Uncharacterized protein n=1 Tax=Luteococcus japonicus LSP_Lj1 TaxID=1255658 RepID=A0A1R4IID5_9ACTN|nr:hypothetical protein FM114_02010 [Luteococcus japonicus LSP_Lj1]
MPPVHWPRARGAVNYASARCRLSCSSAFVCPLRVPSIIPDPTKETAWLVTVTRVPSSSGSNSHVTSPVASGSPSFFTVSVYTTSSFGTILVYSVSAWKSRVSGGPHR